MSDDTSQETDVSDTDPPEIVECKKRLKRARTDSRTSLERLERVTEELEEVASNGSLARLRGSLFPALA